MYTRLPLFIGMSFLIIFIYRHRHQLNASTPTPTPEPEPFANIDARADTDTDADSGVGVYPNSVVTPLLAHIFPYIGKNQVSTQNASAREWKHPSYNITSMKQLTNNLRYFRSPDIGTALRPEFTDAMYKPIRNKTNVVHPMGPAETGDGVRVGYYRAKPNLLTFSNPTNISIGA